MRLLAEELSAINFKEQKDNKRESRTLLFILSCLSLGYIMLALYFLHWLWYHYVVSVFSGLVFGYIVKVWYFESERKKLLRESNEFLEAYARCYEGNNGNMILSLVKAMERGSPRIKRLIGKLEDALKSEFYEYECRKVRELLSIDSLRSFIDILIVLKGKGRGANAGGEDLFLKAFQQLSFSAGQEILIIEKNELDNKTTELWVLLAPMAAIPGTHLIYLLLFQEYFDVLSSYNSLEAKTTATLTFLISSLGAIFLNWIRKNR